MVMLIFALVAAVLMLFSVALLKLYRHTPAKEMKRQARSGDHLAKEFYRVVAYGRSLDILLWIFIGLTSALFFVLAVEALPWPLAFLLVLGIIWFGFAWLPNTHVSRFTIRAAQYITPGLHWLLEHLQPVLVRINHFTERLQPLSIHTGMYTKEDIVELIQKQRIQIDNRITKEELFIVEHALQFGEKSVDEVMTPRRVMKTVATTDLIGPILFKELHDSGHSRFPVYKDGPDDIIGTLYLRDALNAKAGGFVKDLVRKEVFYVNQNQSLARVLDAFIKTKHHQFLVVNNFEEIVGLVTIEDVIEQILGKQIIDEFDSYDDLRAVAAMQAEKDEKKREKPIKEDAHASETETTVVESEEDESKSSK
jgi:CBS domain containing-hemolysin-like protein